jgi:hypothetical protein
MLPGELLITAAQSLNAEQWYSNGSGDSQENMRSGRRKINQATDCQSCDENVSGRNKGYGALI